QPAKIKRLLEVAAPRELRRPGMLLQREVIRSVRPRQRQRLPLNLERGRASVQLPGASNAQWRWLPLVAGIAGRDRALDLKVSPRVVQLDAGLGHGEAADQRRTASGTVLGSQPVGPAVGCAHQMELRLLKFETP